jgi:hypothetical protein
MVLAGMVIRGGVWDLDILMHIFGVVLEEIIIITEQFI